VGSSAIIKAEAWSSTLFFLIAQALRSWILMIFELFALSNGNHEIITGRDSGVMSEHHYF